MPDRAFIDQLAEVWDAVIDVGGDLGENDWDLATDCPGWTVRDSLAHMSGTERMLLGVARPAAAHEGRDYVKNPIGEMNEAWVEERRSWPGERVLAEFVTVTRDRLAALRAMSDAELDAETASPIGQVPYAIFMDVRVMDCWVHEQDIRRAVGRPGHLAGAAVESSIDRLAAGFSFVVGKRVAPADGTTVVIEVTGDVSRHLAVQVAGGRATPVPPPPEPTTAILTDTETFACLVAGRWTAAYALEQGRAKIAGDQDLGERVLAALNIIP